MTSFPAPRQLPDKNAVAVADFPQPLKLKAVQRTGTRRCRIVNVRGHRMQPAAFYHHNVIRMCDI